eukprot:4524938-Pyramimonas_sp.AAC.1
MGLCICIRSCVQDCFRVPKTGSVCGDSEGFGETVLLQLGLERLLHDVDAGMAEQAAVSVGFLAESVEATGEIPS